MRKIKLSFTFYIYPTRGMRTELSIRPDYDEAIRLVLCES